MAVCCGPTPRGRLHTSAHRQARSGGRMTMSDLRYYAVRQVNPFEGILQVVETANARAYSANGQVWQVQVLAERPDHTWRSPGQAAPTRQFFGFGLWDPEDGLSRVAANPVLDIGAMTTAAQSLIASLQTLLERVPFRLIDRFECWSTDGDGRPIALLATTEDPTLIPQLHIAPWRATRSADRGFVSASLAETTPEDWQAPRQHAERLEHAVREAGPRSAWFERVLQGRAHRVDSRGNRFGAALFDLPPTVLTTQWTDVAVRRWVLDYLDWLAPGLLLTDTLDDALRGRLEIAACRRAAELEAVWRLIPRIIDVDLVAAARVEARLRRARPGAARPESAKRPNQPDD